MSLPPGVWRTLQQQVLSTDRRRVRRSISSCNVADLTRPYCGGGGTRRYGVSATSFKNVINFPYLEC